MPASSAGELATFYDEVFNMAFGRTIKDSNTAYQTWASAGVKWNIGDRYDKAETTMIHMAVPSLTSYADKVKAAGGKVLTDPTELAYHPEFVETYKDKFAQFKFGAREDVTETLGRFQICLDPQGNHFGIIELDQWAAKLFENGEISKIEIAEQQASLVHAQEFTRRGLG